MNSVITKFEAAYRKPKVTDVRSGDSVRVHQKVREGGKERTQVFEGMVIRERRKNSLTANITVRRVASGVGVEKTFFLHSPTVIKVEVTKRTKVRRNFLSYMRERTGRSTRLEERDFDRESVNVKEEVKQEELTQEEKEELAKQAEAEKPSKKEEKAEKEEKSEDKEAKSGKKEEVSKEKEEKPAKDDKAAEKKAKAEEFRKAQEAKK